MTESSLERTVVPDEDDDMESVVLESDERETDFVLLTREDVPSVSVDVSDSDDLEEMLVGDLDVEDSEEVESFLVFELRESASELKREESSGESDVDVVCVDSESELVFREESEKRVLLSVDTDDLEVMVIDFVDSSVDSRDESCNEGTEYFLSTNDRTTTSSELCDEALEWVVEESSGISDDGLRLSFSLVCLEVSTTVVCFRVGVLE